MALVSSLTRRFLASLPTILLISVAALAALGAGIAAGLLAGIPPAHLLADAAAVMEAPFYVGAISYLGILAMAMTAAVCLFGYLLLRATGRLPEPRKLLLALGIISLVFCLDDLYQIHETVPVLTGRWGAQRLLYGIYAAGILLFLVRFRRSIGDTDWPVMFAAFALVGGSGLIDQVGLPIDREYQVVTNTIEDVMKLVGIALWTVYALTTAFRHVSSALATGTGESQPAAHERDPARL